MGKKLLEIEYNMTLDEISEGFKLFQKKYQLKRTILYTVVYLIAFGIGIDLIIGNPNNFYGYVLIGLSAGLIVWQWYKPAHIRRKMISTISALNEEQYLSEFYDDKIRITTKIMPEENAADDENDGKEDTDSADSTDSTDGASDERADSGDSGENEAEITPADGENLSDDAQPQDENVTTELFFGTDYLDALENDTMFLLFVNKRLIYIYPKRCLDDSQQTTLRQILTDRSIL